MGLPIGYSSEQINAKSAEKSTPRYPRTAALLFTC